MDCIFCKIINKEISSYKIYEDDYVYAFLDLNQTDPGHTLVIPKEHTKDIETIDDEALSNLIKITKKLSKKIVNILEADGYTIAQNNGIAQEVKHFHIHILPRYSKKKKLSIEEVYKKITDKQ